MFVKKVKQRLEVCTRFRSATVPSPPAVVSPCPLERHALACHCTLDSNDALWSTILSLLRVQHPRWHRGRWYVKHVLPHLTSHPQGQAPVRSTRSIPLVRTSVRHAVQQALHKHSYSHSWTIRHVAHPHPHLRFFTDVCPFVILIHVTADLLQQPAASAGHVASGTLASSDHLGDSC